MVDAVAPVRNAQAPWSEFSSHDYWTHNYQQVVPEDREIIRLVSLFLIEAFAGRRLAQRAIDVGSGTNLYPALLMLPWTEQILLSDYSASNVRWLRDQVANGDAGNGHPGYGPDEDSPWTWQPFWRELQRLEGYSRISEPREHLRDACASVPQCAGIEQRSVFDLPKAQWDLGTMFFVAESMTEDPAEFREAIGCFVGALRPGAPFAAAFMAGSDGYDVGDNRFPALKVSREDVLTVFTELGAGKVRVERPETDHRVRPGYSGMIVTTGIAGAR
jgi:hypothetical protein